MTRLRQWMLEELERRNYSASTIRYYLQFAERIAKHFGKSPEKLGPEHLGTYWARLNPRTSLRNVPSIPPIKPAMKLNKEVPANSVMHPENA